MLPRLLHRQAPLLVLVLVLLLLQGAAAFRLFGRSKSAPRATAPLPLQSAAPGAGPAAPSGGVVGRLLDKLNPLRIKDYGSVQ